MPKTQEATHDTKGVVMEQFFSSDLHLFHENMFVSFRIPCTYCGGSGEDDGVCTLCKGTGKIPARPFTSITEMHDVMMKNHNGRVASIDHWWNLGDITMLRGGKPQQEQMQTAIRLFNGHKRLILGNHDHLDMMAYRSVFEKIKGSHKIDNLLFTHFPLHESCIPKGCVNVHGHIHTQASPAGPYINISVEAINYIPLSLGELKEKAALKLGDLN